jgi:hypothetical protein
MVNCNGATIGFFPLVRDVFLFRFFEQKKKKNEKKGGQLTFAFCLENCHQFG